MCAISAIGVIFLKRVRIVSKHAGIYLSKKITKFAFSVDTFLVSIQLVTYGFHPRSCGFMYKIPARLTYECTQKHQFRFIEDGIGRNVYNVYVSVAMYLFIKRALPWLV